jgi:hypothetical protein
VNLTKRGAHLSKLVPETMKLSALMANVQWYRAVKYIIQHDPIIGVLFLGQFPHLLESSALQGSFLEKFDVIQSDI